MEQSNLDSYRVLKTASSNHDKSFPYFREPSEIGYFSIDSKRQFHNDSRQLKNFCPPKDQRHCNMDLSHGYEKLIRKDESVKEYLDNLLLWIMKNKHKFLIKGNNQTLKDDGDSKGLPSCSKPPQGDSGQPRISASSTSKDLTFHSLSTDFVCWRGLLTRLICAPYENREDLMIAVVKFRGTYYLCEFETESKKQQKEQTTPRQEEMCAWGWKFEQYVTADKSHEEPNISSPVNTNEEYATVVRSRLDSHSLVYGAEVDCEDPRRQKGNRYVELKTSRLIESQRQHENFCKYKLIKWWAQSFLIGIPAVVCGYRDDNGIVKSLQTYNVNEMHSLVKDSVRQPWKPNVCFNFLKTFLDYIKSNITEDNERCVHLFYRAPGKDMVYEKRNDDEEFKFLPRWFTTWDAWDMPVNIG